MYVFTWSNTLKYYVNIDMAQNPGSTLEELMRKRFLFEGTEVQLTGRYAKKQNRSTTPLLFEIRPTTSAGNAPAWKRWVKLVDMYEIYHPLSHKVEFAEDLMDAVRRVAEQNKKEQ